MNKALYGIPIRIIIMASAIFAVAVIAVFLVSRIGTAKDRRTKRRIKSLAAGVKEITPYEFFRLRNERKSNGKVSSKERFSGIYILHNKTKDMVYVGQARDLFQRVNNHLTGHGNGDVYADYKYGDNFTIRLISLKGSGFKSLNELERHAIITYGCVAKGYNRKRGNNTGRRKKK